MLFSRQSCLSLFVACALSLVSCEGLTRAIGTPFNTINRMFDSTNRSIQRVIEHDANGGPLRIDSGEIERAREGENGLPDGPSLERPTDGLVAYAR